MRVRLSKKLPGLSWDIAASPWSILFYSLLLYLVAAAGAMVIRSVIIVLITIVYARTAAISPNLIDAVTAQPVTDEMATSIKSWVDVKTTTISNSATPATAYSNSLQIGDLYIVIWSTDGNYVTTSMVYGASLPVAGLWQRIGFTPSVIPIEMPPISLYREW